MDGVGSNAWGLGQGVDCSITLGSYPPERGCRALECRRHLILLLVTRATWISVNPLQRNTDWCCVLLSLEEAFLPLLFTVSY